MLDSTVESVTSALKRARATLQRRAPSEREAPPPSGSPVETELVRAFVTAYEASDVDAVVALMTDDVLVSMPPVPLEYEGREAAAGFCAAVIRPDRTFRLLPTRANGQVGFGIDFAVRHSAPKSAEEMNGVVGEFFWDGAASTLFWVDPANQLTAVLFTQVMPFDGQLHKVFRDAVYGPFTPTPR